MTRIPQLEQELVAAAARRSRPRLVRWPSPRLLVPVVAAVLAVWFVAPLQRTQETEIEVPAARFAASARPPSEDLLRGPLGTLVDAPMIDERVRPLVMTPAGWVVAVFAAPDGKVCVSATPEDPSLRFHGGTSCSPVSAVAGAIRGRTSGLGGLTVGTESLVYGLVHEDARDVVVGEDEQRAALSEDVFAIAGGVRARLYAIEYRPRPATPVSEETRVTYADGKTRPLTP